MWQVIYATVIAAVCAQVLKLIVSKKFNHLKMGDLPVSGGMPSGHSAIVGAVITVLALNKPDSLLLGAAIAFGFIVLYDSLGVRRTTGEQTEAIRELQSFSVKKVKKTVVHKSAGHSVVEILVGLVIGMVTGVVVFNIT